MASIDLNCDMGEGFGVYSLGDDDAMLEIVSSANIACGFHAGDPLVMAKTIAAAKAKGVGVGAHPSLYDLWGFGRRPFLGERPEDIEKQVLYQIGAMQALAAAEGVTIGHVKAHGSLANMVNEDMALARAVARAVKTAAPNCVYVVMPGLPSETAGAEFGLKLAREIYADRAYADNGNLASRKLPGAVLHDADEAAERIMRILATGHIVSVGGTTLPVKVDTICVHGDTPGATDMARRIKARLEAANWSIRPMATWL